MTDTLRAIEDCQRVYSEACHSVMELEDLIDRMKAIKIDLLNISTKSMNVKQTLIDLQEEELT